MKRYDVNWGPFLGQGGDVVCDGDVCRIVPPGTQPTVPVQQPVPGAALAPQPSSSSSISVPWLAAGAAAAVGLLVLAFR